VGRALVIIRSKADRQRIAKWAAKAPQGTRVEFKASKRSLPQNSKLWASLTDVARQIRWYGVTLTPDDWKLVFVDSLRRESRLVPNIDGDGFVNLGRSSADLSKEEMSDLIELVLKFGAERGVKFDEDKAWKYLKDNSRGEDNG
jgi:hypothetical protein